MKKRISICLILIVALLLVGCGDGAISGKKMFKFEEPQRIELTHCASTKNPAATVDDQEVIQKVCDMIQTVKLKEGGEPGEGGSSLKIVCKNQTYEIGYAANGITYDGKYYKITNDVDLTSILEMLKSDSVINNDSYNDVLTDSNHFKTFQLVLPEKVLVPGTKIVKIGECWFTENKDNTFTLIPSSKDDYQVGRTYPYFVKDIENDTQLNYSLTTDREEVSKGELSVLKSSDMIVYKKDGVGIPYYVLPRIIKKDMTYESVNYPKYKAVEEGYEVDGKVYSYLIEIVYCTTADTYLIATNDIAIEYQDIGNDNSEKEYVIVDRYSFNR